MPSSTLGPGIMNLDSLLTQLPFFGVFFEKTYAYWRLHIALANTTHIALGIGVALFILTNHKKSGIAIVILALVMHTIAFFS